MSLIFFLRLGKIIEQFVQSRNHHLSFRYQQAAYPSRAYGQNDVFDIEKEIATVGYACQLEIEPIDPEIPENIESADQHQTGVDIDPEGGDDQQEQHIEKQGQERKGQTHVVAPEDNEAAGNTAAAKGNQIVQAHDGGERSGFSPLLPQEQREDALAEEDQEHKGRNGGLDVCLQYFERELTDILAFAVSMARLLKIDPIDG